MQISTWFLAEHARVHSAAIGPLHDWHVAPGFSIQREEDTICDGLSNVQVRQRPGGLNSIAWLLWHLARCEDVGVNLILRGRSEVLDDEQWLPRLQVETRHIGTGASEDEVRQFSACVDVDMLRAYRAAVGRATQAWAAALDVAVLEQIPDVRARLSEAPATLTEHSAWVAAGWEGRTGSWFLSYLVVAHAYWHLGEAYVTRARLGGAVC